MKINIRTLGIDDAEFKFKITKYVPIVGALVRGNSYLEAVIVDKVKVDGFEVTEKLYEIISNSKYNKQIKAIFFDGIAVGGFNVIDIDKLYELLKIPIITITRDKPDFKKIKSALKMHFDDWHIRYELISKNKLVKIPTQHNPIYVSYKGIDIKEMKEIIKISTLRGVIPEPLRLAHIIASALSRGESHGRS